MVTKCGKEQSKARLSMGLAILTTILVWVVTSCQGKTPTPIAAVQPPVVSEPKVGASTPLKPKEEVGISIDVSKVSGVTLTYTWSADGGEIVRGQGSPAITYRAPDEPGTYNVRVTLKLDGQSMEKATSIKVEKPMPTIATPTPTPSASPTKTQTATPTPDYDFEQSTQYWGEHPQSKLLVEGRGVEVYCDRQANTGNCSLKFEPREIINNNAYVTVLRKEPDTSVTITAYISVPTGVELCISNNCSTAKIIVWDSRGISHESEYEKLRSGRWASISWDLRRESWRGPWEEFGIHFWLATDYRGPFYIDTVTIRR